MKYRSTLSLKEYRFSLTVALITTVLLIFVRWKAGADFLLFDRLFAHGGWLQIGAAAFLSGWMALRIVDRATRPSLRKLLWLIFSIVFFGQLLLGLIADVRFLMSGTLHFPIPSVILTGAIYRCELGFMPILFLITVLLSGGAWCSYLCYFGAFDSWAGGSGKHPSSDRLAYRAIFGVLFVAGALALRLFGASMLYATIAAAVSGIVGVGIIAFISVRKKTMVHCSYFCPLGTIVSFLRFASPFRFHISSRCTRCMACTTSCPYGALAPKNIEKGAPSLNCTTCGDCMSRCRHNAFEYRFFRCSPEVSERIFMGVVTVLYTLFITVARI